MPRTAYLPITGSYVFIYCVEELPPKQAGEISAFRKRLNRASQDLHSIEMHISKELSDVAKRLLVDDVPLSTLYATPNTDLARILEQAYYPHEDISKTKYNDHD